MGAVIFSGPISFAIPRGGRPLVMVNSTPEARRRSTAWQVRSVRVLSRVTSVPSTSAISSLMVMGVSRAAVGSMNTRRGGSAHQTDVRVGHHEGRQVFDQGVQPTLAVERLPEQALL